MKRLDLVNINVADTKLIVLDINYHKGLRGIYTVQIHISTAQQDLKNEVQQTRLHTYFVGEDYEYHVKMKGRKLWKSGLHNQKKEEWEARTSTCVLFAYHQIANINHCLYIRESWIVLQGLKKKITLKISLKSGNHALPQDKGGG